MPNSSQAHPHQWVFSLMWQVKISWTVMKIVEIDTHEWKSWHIQMNFFFKIPNRFFSIKNCRIFNILFLSIKTYFSKRKFHIKAPNLLLWYGNTPSHEHPTYSLHSIPREGAYIFWNSLNFFGEFFCQISTVLWWTSSIFHWSKALSEAIFIFFIFCVLKILKKISSKT